MGELSTELRLIKIERRLDQLERRLTAVDDVSQTEPVIERSYAPAPLPAPTPAPSPAPTVTPPPLPTTPIAPAAPLSPAPYDERGFVTSDVEAQDADSADFTPPAPPPIASSTSPSGYDTAESFARQPRKPKSPANIEQAIGLKWAGWIGAVVLVIGAALGVKYAYDQHWFGHLPPTFRLAMIVAAGFALIAAGEIVLRKIHAVPAASLFGAGVATLFVAAYVGYAYYDLYGASTSEIAMTLATLVGAAIAMRGNMVSIGVLALIGGNIAPLAVGENSRHIAPTISFLSYLLMLQLVALFLAAWGSGTRSGGKWWTLRGLSLATTSFWMFVKLIPFSRHELILLTAMIVFAAIYHAELIFTTVRRSRELSKDRTNIPGVALSFFVTAALVIGVLWFHADASDALRGAWVLGIAGACMTLGFTLPRVNPALAPLGYTHRVSAVALAILWIPIAMHGESILIGWLALGVAFAMSWVLVGSVVSRYASIATWMLALARLGFMTIDAGAHPIIWMTLLDTLIAREAILAWIAAITGWIIATLITVKPKMIAVDRAAQSSDWTHGATVISLLATVVWCGAAVIHLPAVGSSSVILAGAWLLMLFGESLAPKLSPTLQSASMIVLVAVKWAIIDALATRLSPRWSATEYRPILNPLMGMGAAIAASFAALHFIRGKALLRALKKQDELDATARATAMFALIFAIIAIFTIGFSFEIDRIVMRAVPARLDWPVWQLEQISWTMLWCVSIVAIATAFVKLIAPRRKTSLGWLLVVPALLAIKYIVIDTFLGLIFGRRGIHEIAPPLFNIQLLAGVVVIGSIAFVHWLLTYNVSAKDSASQAITMRKLRGQLVMLAVIVLTWMGTMEIDRAVSWFGVTTNAWHIKNIGFTIWWMLCAAGTFALRRRFERDALPTESWLTVLPVCAMLIATKYLAFDTALWRFQNHPMQVSILLNIEVPCALIVLLGASLILWMGLPESSPPPRRQWLRNQMSSIVVLVLLWAGTIEIDRAFWLPSIRGTLSAPSLAEQVAMSIFWSLFAVATVVSGFILRAAKMRYFGLALLAITLLKVVVIDLNDVEKGYRILSFLGLGALLLGTSVVYGKVSPKLLRESAEVL